MAHKKGVGSTDNGRDSKSKRLGVKLFGGQVAKAGNIIIRQRGTKYHPGENVYMGKDFTIHAAVDGKVSFRKSYRDRMYVSIDVDGADANGGSAAVAELPVKKATVAKAKAAVALEAPAAAQAVADVKPAGNAGGKVTLPSGKSFMQDDLKIVEGIGPKIESILHGMGITTWQGLADSDADKVKETLNEAGSQFRLHNPGTWARQAKLAVEGKWAELEQLQDELDGGKE